MLGAKAAPGFFDHLDHTWLLDMLRVRIDDRAFLNLVRK
jgi:retron-type reverse transcriptase